MNNTLKESIENIYQEYQPLASPEKGLIGLQSVNQFEKVALQIIETLPAEHQERLKAELFDWGPLVPLLDREDIFDILIQGPQDIYFESPTGMEKLDDEFLSQKSFQNFVDRILNEAGMLVNQKDPYGNGKLGKFRIHITIPPLSPQVTITLRRHRTKSFSLDELDKGNYFCGDSRKILENILSEKKSFLVIGPTGSGKTTLLNALLNELPNNERIVIAEDTDELKTPNSISCKLLSRTITPPRLTPYDLGELVKQTLRMRPDRIVVGEVRGAEAKDLLQALATGHEGSMGTLHAQSAKQALIRLEMLIQMGAPHWSLQSIRRLIQFSLEYLIVLNSDRRGKGILEISKISSLESFGLLLETIESRD